ncbi:MAG: hypothetical protein JNM62_10585 [Flavobacteriales bacterium]|nr:hypothetical protein [Flavobacteriales bacterium]
MRHSFILPSILAIGCSAPPANTVEEATLGNTNRIELNGLIGEWQDVQDSGRTVFNENWSRHPDGSLQGLGFVLSGKDTVFIEHLAILDIDSETHYAATIRSQNNGQAVLFKLIHDHDSLVFAAPAHDFPQRIVYTPVGREHWNVTVSGVQKGQALVEHYHFQRRKHGSR